MRTNKIQVATDATWPPFEYIDPSSNQIIGFDIDLMNAIAEKAGLAVEFVDVRWDPLLDDMEQCKYDAAISSMTITEERKRRFAFSDTYFAAGQIIIVQFSNTTIAGKEDLAGKTIGVQSGTTGEDEARKFQDANIQTYDDINVAFQDLMNGRIDAVFADYPMALVFIGKNANQLKTVGDALTDESYGIAICKTRSDLVQKINQGLDAVRAEGLIDQLVQKWILSGK
jgi:polar amino acid transport system substrate-binding protein